MTQTPLGLEYNDDGKKNNINGFDGDKVESVIITILDSQSVCPFTE